MAEIKSAYERAMERFKDVEPDRGALKKEACIKRGKTMCAQKIHGESVDIIKELHAAAPADQKYIHQGIAETLLAQINLPSNEFDLQRIAVISEVAESISTQPSAVQNLLQQFMSLCQEYIANKTELTDELKAQYMQLMQQQQGQGRRMDPNMLQAMQEQLQQLDEHFLPSVEEVRESLAKLIELEEA